MDRKKHHYEHYEHKGATSRENKLVDVSERFRFSFSSLQELVAIWCRVWIWLNVGESNRFKKGKTRGFG